MAVKPKLPAQSSAGMIVHPIKGMQGTHNDIGELSGFITEGYIDKKGTQYGDGAKFNYMPPGMDIANQECSDQRDMALKHVTEMSYPGDGWEPAPRDIPE